MPMTTAAGVGMSRHHNPNVAGSGCSVEGTIAAEDIPI